MTISLSSGHFSADQQIADAVDALTIEQNAAFLEAFPEWDTLTWSGSWVDLIAAGLDSEYMNWVADWIEQNTSIIWADGEPYLIEADDIRCGTCEWWHSQDGTYDREPTDD